METTVTNRVAMRRREPVEVSPNWCTELNNPLLTTMAAYNTRMNEIAASMGAAIVKVVLFFLCKAAA